MCRCSTLAMRPTSDFQPTGQRAARKYQPLVGIYGHFARAVYPIFRTCLNNEDIKATLDRPSCRRRSRLPREGVQPGPG